MTRYCNHPKGSKQNPEKTKCEMKKCGVEKGQKDFHLTSMPHNTQVAIYAIGRCVQTC
jgi:hypothetical protein